jgi:hypothetical protein
MDIGNSTLNMAIDAKAGAVGDANPAVGVACAANSTTFAAQDTYTWLEDVMKTWEVSALRNSGVLEKTEGGQDIATYLNDLDRDDEEDDRGAANSSKDDVGDSGSSDEEGASEDDEQLQDQDCAVSGGDSAPAAMRDQGMRGGQTAAHMANIANFQKGEIGAQGSVKFEDTESNRFGIVNDPFSSVAKPEGGVRGAALLMAGVGLDYGRPSSHLSSGSSATPSRQAPGGHRPGQALAPAAPKIAPRPAARIAPAPVMGLLGGEPGQGGANYPGGVAQQMANVPPAPAPVIPACGIPPKRRGRKRKNPDLTEEERALVRKQQNRESAKLSRVRRKVIAAEYEDQISELVESNEKLREQVSALTNKLTCLQSILTVSVVPAGQGPAATNAPHAREEESSSHYGSGTESSASRHTAVDPRQTHYIGQQEQSYYNTQGSGGQQRREAQQARV